MLVIKFQTPTTTKSLLNHFNKFYKASKSTYTTGNLDICYVPKVEPIVTVLDVLSSNLGRNVALLLKQNPLIDELRLYDKSTAVCNVAEDLSHIDTRAKVVSFGGLTTLKNAVQGAAIVVSVGGCKKKPCETPSELFERNVDEVRAGAMHAAEFNPKGIFCVAKPPVEAFVPMVSEEYKHTGTYNRRKIIGITSVASIRANRFIAHLCGQDPASVFCPIVGGMSEKTIVAVVSQTRPQCAVDAANTKQLLDSIAYGEDDVLNAYEGHSHYCLAPAVGIARFINSLLKAIQGDKNCVDCAFVHQTGQIGQFLTYMTSIVKLGREGIESCHMPKINESEAERLKAAGKIIRENISLGENYGFSIVKDKKITDEDIKCNLLGNTRDDIEMAIKEATEKASAKNKCKDEGEKEEKKMKN